MKNPQKLIKKLIELNYGIKGKTADRLSAVMLKMALIEFTDRIDQPMIEEMLYREGRGGRYVNLDHDEDESALSSVAGRYRKYLEDLTGWIEKQKHHAAAA